jgi:hypothetical protein
MAAPVENLSAAFLTSPRNVAVEDGFHWGIDPDGVPHHDMEVLMTAIEGSAVPAFSHVLDTVWALPERWPPTLADRIRLSWWVAAQVLRSTRQRSRLDYLAAQAGEAGMAEALDPPTEPLHRFARNNRHLEFVFGHIAHLAAIVAAKSWGIAFSDVCQPTSDVPVVLMNGHDDENQVLSVAYWDLLVPLDPHRFLLMTTPGAQEDPATWADHRLKVDGGMGFFFTDLLWSAAERHVFWHPDHPPQGLQDDAPRRGPRLPRPWAGDTHSAPEWVMDYGAMEPNTTVERRWMDHTAAGAVQESTRSRQ